MQAGLPKHIVLSYIYYILCILEEQKSCSNHDNDKIEAESASSNELTIITITILLIISEGKN